MTEPNATQLVRVLANRGTLRALAAIVLGAASRDEVAERTGLDAEEAERAIGRLAGVGLVAGTARLELVPGALEQAARRPTPELPGATAEQRAVLRHFVDENGRLAELPARAGRRRLVLEYAAGRIEPGREYPEPELNALLHELHDDHATLRRLLVDEGLLEREAGVYRRR